MRIRFMRVIDDVPGSLLCLALTLLDLPLRPLRSRSLEGVRNILVCKFLGLGSIVLAAPMARELRRRFPGAKIHFLTFDENRRIAEMLEVFDDVWTVRSASLLAFAWDSLACLLRCWRQGIDLAFDLEFFTRYSALMTWLSGARLRVGYQSEMVRRGSLHTHEVYFNGTKHISRIFLALVEKLGFPSDEGRSLEAELPKLAPNAAAHDRARQAMFQAGLDPQRPYLAVNPNASELCLERRWLPERFAAVVEALLKDDPSLQLVFVGSAGERAYTESVLAQCQAGSRGADLAGRLSLEELLELLRGARLFLTNDSGPLHLATLAGTPTVALFGPETPALYGPLGARQKAFYAGVYCSPCLNVFTSKAAAPCKGVNICMQAIGAAEVLAAARALSALPGRAS